MANWSLPTITDLYTNFLSYLKSRDDDATRMHDTRVTAATNVPDYAKRWNDTTKTFQNWLSSAWSSLVLSVAGGGTGATTAADARTNLSVYSTTEVDAAIAASAAHTTANNVLSSNVSLTSESTWYTGPSVSLTAGTWLVIANFNLGVLDATNVNFICAVKSSVTTFASGILNASDVAFTTLPLSVSGIVTLASTTTVTGSGQRAGGSSTNYIQGTYSNIVAVKIA